MIDAGGPGKVPLVARSENTFTMVGTGRGVRQGCKRLGHRDDPALDRGRSELPQEIIILGDRGISLVNMVSP